MRVDARSILRSGDLPFRELTDEDINADPSLLGRYAAVIISTHSEYWSQRMYDGLANYLDRGATFSPSQATKYSGASRATETRSRSAKTVLPTSRQVIPAANGATLDAPNRACWGCNSARPSGARRRSPTPTRYSSRRTGLSRERE